MRINEIIVTDVSPDDIDKIETIEEIVGIFVNHPEPPKVTLIFKKNLTPEEQAEVLGKISAILAG